MQTPCEDARLAHALVAHIQSALIFVGLCLVLLAEGGCGAHIDPVPQLSPASVTLQTSSTQQFSVRKLFGGTVWLVNGVVGGNATVGTIDANGLYTAPETAVAAPVTITAQGGSAPGQETSAVVQLVNPAPKIQTFDPAVATATGSALSVNIIGTGFTRATTISAAGTPVAFTYVSSTNLRAQIPADMTWTGGLSLAVANPAPGGGDSQPITLPILSPAVATLLVNSSIQLAIADLPGGTDWYVNGVKGGTGDTGTISGNGLYIAPSTPPAEDVIITASARSAPTLRVSASLSVVNPPPAVTAISPAFLFAPVTGRVTVTGSRFVLGSRVLVGGALCDTSYVSDTTLTATLPADLPAQSGSVPIQVVTPAPGGGTSNSAALTVLAGAVTTTSHPLVARYSIDLPAGSSVTVDFGLDPNYGRSTWAVPAPNTGGTTTVLVAGMKANSLYHLRARISLPDGSMLNDADQQFATGSLPPKTFPQVTVNNTGVATTGVNMAMSWGTDVHAVALDNDGSVIWYYDGPIASGGVTVRQLENGDFLMLAWDSDVREVDLEGRTVRSISLADLNANLSAAGYGFAVSTIHHDVIQLPNKHWLLLANENRDFQDLPGYPGTTTVLGDVLIDVDENNQPVWVWRAFDYLDINRHPFQFPDWTHANSLVYMPDCNLLLSVRHQSWIIKIDYAGGHGTGDILWRLGAEGDFNLAGGDPAQWFYNQHHPTLLDHSASLDRISLFDNGDTRPDGGQLCPVNNSCYSRAIVMDVDESARTAAVEWQYDANWFASWGGSVSVLSGGDVVMTSSTVEDNAADAAAGTVSKIVEVNGAPSPSIVWELDVKNANFYRAERIPSLYPGVNW